MATRSVTGKSGIGLTGTYKNAATGAGESGETARITFGENDKTAFTGGTGANQAQRMWSSEGRTLSGSATENIDLYDFGSLDIGGGAGKDVFGGSMALTGIKGVYVQNNSSSTGDLLVGGLGATTAWNSIFNGDDDALIVLAPGAKFGYEDPSAAGLAVADTTNHLLKIAASSAGAVDYDIVVIGI